MILGKSITAILISCLVFLSLSSAFLIDTGRILGGNLFFDLSKVTGNVHWADEILSQFGYSLEELTCPECTTPSGISVGEAAAAKAAGMRPSIFKYLLASIFKASEHSVKRAHDILATKAQDAKDSQKN